MGNLVGGIVGTIGGILGGNSAAKAARAQAESLRQAGQQAFEVSRFRPVGITTRFGSSQFEVDPTTGALTSAGYTMDPQLAALQDRLLSGVTGDQFSQQAMQRAQGLFGLGEQFLPTSPETTMSPEAAAYAAQLRGLSGQVLPTSYDPTAAAQQYVQQQQALLRPERERQLAETREGLFRSGRGGLGVAQGGDLQATNPEMAAYYNALARQDAELAARGSEIGRQRLAEDIRLGTSLGADALSTQQRAEEIARQRMLGNLQVGTGLFETGLGLATKGFAPLTTQFDIAKALEASAQQPLALGQTLGQTASQINANAAQLRLNPQTQAAGVQYKADSWNPWAAAFQGLGNTFGGMSMPTGGSGSLFGMGGSISTPLTYGTNFGSQQSNMLAEQDKWFR